MSLLSVAPGIAAWGMRGAAVGLGIDLGLGVAGQQINFRNVAINLVHGVAIGIIGALFGNPVAVGAFFASCLILGPSIFLENSGMNRDAWLKSISLRTIAILFGSVIGSLL